MLSPAGATLENQLPASPTGLGIATAKLMSAFFDRIVWSAHVPAHCHLSSSQYKKLPLFFNAEEIPYTNLLVFEP